MRSRRPLYKTLYFQVICAIIIGVLFGIFLPRAWCPDETPWRRLHQINQNDHCSGNFLYRCYRYCRNGRYEKLAASVAMLFCTLKWYQPSL